MNVKDLKPGMVIDLPGFLMSNSYGGFTWHGTELTSYVTICPHRITTVVPDGFNGLQAELSTIDRDIENARETYHQTLGNLTARRQELLQLSAPEAMQVVEAGEPLQMKDCNDCPF